MEQLGSILPRAIKNQILRRKPPVADVLAPLWPHVVGKLIARHSRPVAFAEGRLTVAVSSEEWAIQLNEMRELVRTKANEFMGRAVVRRILVNHQKDWDEGKTAPEMRERRTAPASMELAKARAILWPEGKGGLDPSVAEAVERSFVKYFSRGPRGRD